jgi:hypothetical protein
LKLLEGKWESNVSRVGARIQDSGFRSAGEGDTKNEKAILNEEKILCLFISPLLACFAGRLLPAISPERVV